MRLLVFFLTAAAALAGTARYARLGEFEGMVEVQLSAADPWIPAVRNLPLPEGTWVRTGAGARVEIELDDGSAWRLGPESEGALSDYTTLSTGQRITLIAAHRGLTYFTAENRGMDSMALAMPGAQLTIGRAAQVRVGVADGTSQVFVLQGSVTFSSPAATLELGRRQTARVEPDKPSRFFLDREFESIELDDWNAARVKALAAPVARLHVNQAYGLADLDATGEWIQTDQWGLVWKPKVAATWVPFQNGRWRWYQNLGYTWVADDTWGWLPYHYGRWAHLGEVGWVWSPSSSDVFRPGDVYWMRAAKLAGWGPLAPGEDWRPAVLPRWYLDAYTTFANFTPDAADFAPAGLEDRPKEPLKTMAFAAALPSPAFSTARLDSVRPMVRANVLSATVEVMTPPPAPKPVKANPPPPPPAPVIVVTPPAPADEVFVPYPVLLSAVIYSPILQVAPPTLSSPSRNSSEPAASKPQRPLGRPQPEPGPHSRDKRPHDQQEADLANRAYARMREQQWRNAIRDLDQWMRSYPESDYLDDRLYYRAVASHYLRAPEDVLQFAARIMAKGQEARLDEKQMLDLTYLVVTEAAGMNRLNRQQLEMGRAAAQSLLEMSGKYFTDAKRPAEVKPDAWSKQRQTIDAAAREALKAFRQS